MENTALKMSAKELVAEFTDLHGNADLMKVAMITGSADISRTYENLKNWSKNAIGEDKVVFNNALTILQNITLKRIMITNILYSGKLDEIIEHLQSPVQTTNETAETKSEEIPVIFMIPSLEDTLERVRTLFKAYRANPSKDPKVMENTTAEAFEILKVSVGQGKVLNAAGQPETWDNNQIYAFLDTFKDKPTKVADKYGFETIYGNFNVMIEAGKQEPEIKASLKEILMGKTIGSRDSAGDIVIKDDAVYEDYYSRILKNLVTLGIEAFNKKGTKPVKVKEEVAKQQIEEEIKPFLAEQDKDDTLSSFTPLTKKMSEFYKSLGFNKSLKDLWFDARELAEKYAPNLAKRNKQSKKGDVPVNKTVDVKQMSVEGPSMEIYDDSHNIKESNKELWAEVEKFTYLNELFNKAQELYKLGNWKDALSMSIILISSGQIKETESSKETIKWKTDQVKNWFHTVVEASVTGAVKETIDVTAKEVKDEEKENIVRESSEQTVVSIEADKKVIGPVAKEGQIDTKEGIKKTMLNVVAVLYKDKYDFTILKVRTDHHNDLTMDFEIIAATEEQEPDVFVTEHNLAKFLDAQRDLLVVRRNEEKNIRKAVFEKLSSCYLVTNSEVKRIVTQLVKEADSARKEAKAAGTFERKSKENEETTDSKSNELSNDNTGNESGATSDTTGGDNKENVGTTNAGTTEKVVEIEKEDTTVVVDPLPSESTEKSETKENSPETTTVTDKSAGEEASSSNKVSYEGFEEILKANKKLGFHSAIYDKVLTYPTSEEGLKAVFEVVNQARKDDHYKKSFVRNHMNALPADLLLTINKAYTLGVEHAAQK
jgi:hypothetical protein